MKRKLTFHRHRCPKCKHIWRHKDRSTLMQMLNPMQDEQHRCPKCGTKQYHKYDPKTPGCDGYRPVLVINFKKRYEGAFR